MSEAENISESYRTAQHPLSAYERHQQQRCKAIEEAHRAIAHAQHRANVCSDRSREASIVSAQEDARRAQEELSRIGHPSYWKG